MDELYEDCAKNATRGYYTKALEVCNRVRNVYRDSPLSTLAEITIADIYYKRGDYEQARIAYEDFSRLHPRHERMDYISYRIGLTIYKRSPSAAGRDQSSTRQAVNAWTGFDTRFPESPHVPEVSKYLNKSRDRLARKELHIAKFYAQRKAWKATQGRLEGLLQRYSDTSPAAEAMAELGKAYHKWGLTQKANDIRDLLAKDFPNSKHRNRLDKALASDPGEITEEPRFARPYRISGGLGSMGGR
jgi:outer membrane protein assembly factor BamD